MLRALDDEWDNSDDGYDGDTTQNVWFEPTTPDDGAFGQNALTMLLACPESHKVFMDHYQCLRLLGPNISSLWGEDPLEFSDLRTVPQISFRTTPFDRRRDTLVLDPEEMEALNYSGCWLDFTAIRHLILFDSTRSNLWTPVRTLFSTPELVLNFAKDFPRLKTLSVVIDSEITDKYYYRYGPDGIHTFFEAGANLATLATLSCSLENDPRQSQRSLNAKLAEYQARANFWREGLGGAMEVHKQCGKSRIPKVEVLMHSAICGDPKFGYDVVNLVPSKPSLSGVFFWTTKPTVHFDPQPEGLGLTASEGTRYLHIPAIDCYASCLASGDPLFAEAVSEDIRYLFNE